MSGRDGGFSISPLSLLFLRLGPWSMMTSSSRITFISTIMRTIITLLVLFAATFSQAQTAVQLAPLSGPFLYTNGPNTGGALAFGCVFTYQSNTNIPLATFTDYTGVTQNANPVVLNAGGYGSIWFQSGLLYSVKVVSSGGTNCASGLVQYTINGVNQTLLNLPNEWQQAQTFDLPINILAPDLQIVFGSPSGTQTTLDVPPTSSNVILHVPALTGDDTLLTQNATQPVLNKDFTSGNQFNGCGITNGPGTYVCVANNASTATILNALAVGTGAPTTATVAPTDNIPAILGVVTANAGITGTAVIEQSGIAPCIFDGATTAGDYVTASSSVAGDCHDTNLSSSLLTGSQNGTVGIVLSTNAGGGLYSTLFFPESISSSSAQADGSAVTRNANTTNVQIIQSESFDAGKLNIVGKAFRATAQIDLVPGAGSSNQGLYWTVGAVTTFPSLNTTSSSTDINATMQITCVVRVAGVSGSLSCAMQTFANTGTFVYTKEIVPADLTSFFTVSDGCSFSSGSASNTCTGNQFILESLN